MKLIQKWHPVSDQTDFGMILDVILYYVHSYFFCLIIVILQCIVIVVEYLSDDHLQ